MKTLMVRCWGGIAFFGELGYGLPLHSVGDDEDPATAGDVNIGTSAIAEVISGTGGRHSCARFVNGKVRCWGDNTSGKLGYGNTNAIGDDELPSVAGDVSVGFDVTDLSIGAIHTCALSNSGQVRCWGFGTGGRLGYANTTTLGDDELPSTAGFVSLGGSIAQISSGGSYTCALRNTGEVICWGVGTSGVLGYGNTVSVGDNETPASIGPVNVGGNVVELSAGGSHTCVLLDTGAVRCWGNGTSGLLGYGNTNNIGDDEDPASAGDVELF